MLKDKVTATDHIRGNKNGRIVLLEYGDFECPYCAIAHHSVTQLLDYFKKDLCYVFRNFPLTQLHPHAELSAETAEFASEYGKYWEMHDLLFNNQENLGVELMLQLVDQLKLPVLEYEKALENRTYLSKVRSDFMGGVQNKVKGTPSFFINNKRYEGPYDSETLIDLFKSESKLASGF
jgi:protein-disulfide isomerase